MGLYSGVSRCEPSPAVVASEAAAREQARAKPSGNPNPHRFKVLRARQVGRLAVALVLYPDCRNFEGQKILVFEDVEASTLRLLPRLDPHFCDHADHVSPIARFRPDTAGWAHAILFARTLQ